MMLKKLRLFLVALSIAQFCAILVPAPSYADVCTDKGGTKVSEVFNLDSKGVVGDECVGSSTANPIFWLVNKIITYATGALGVVMVLMIVIAGLQYTVAGGSPDRVRSAKERLEHVATGFILFVIMWGVLQVILPPDVSLFK